MTAFSPAASALAPSERVILAPASSDTRGSTGSADGSVSCPNAQIMTKKEWIIPPRPKPGRKPATDTPPTKRKAQNRAAQRAFRERRAAKVGELEERIKEIEQEDQTEQNGLRHQIACLESQLEDFQRELSAWHQRYDELEKKAALDLIMKEVAEKELEVWRQKYGATETDAVPLLPRLSRHCSTSDTAMATSEVYQAGESTDSALMGCGNCTKDTHCECVAKAVDLSSHSSHDLHDLSPLGLRKRVSSPQSPDKSNKRLCDIPEDNGSSGIPLEIDFTSAYATKSKTTHDKGDFVPDTDLGPSSRLNESDRCGFCQDGTPCVCAELTDELPMAEVTSQSTGGLLQVTPPPSDTEFQPGQGRNKSKPSSCAAGPGTCAQCRRDPNSTLFCKGLAAVKSSQQGSVSGGCTGRSSSTSGCCRSIPNQSSHRSAASPNSTSVYLSCADTFTTLSRHPNYPTASKELGAWLGDLKTSPAKANGKRTAMEVEAASVMSVLKSFDRWFGTKPAEQESNT